MRIKLLNYGKLPTKTHAWDAGYDLYAPFHQLVPAGGSAIIPTGVCFQIPIGMYGAIRSRSGMMFKHEVIAGDGTIDCGYSGEVKVKLFNLGEKDYEIQVGDRIAQIVFSPCKYAGFEVVEELDASDRGSGGFGSTGQ